MAPPYFPFDDWRFWVACAVTIAMVNVLRYYLGVRRRVNQS